MPINSAGFRVSAICYDFFSFFFIQCEFWGVGTETETRVFWRRNDRNSSSCCVHRKILVHYLKFIFVLILNFLSSYYFSTWMKFCFVWVDGLNAWITLWILQHTKQHLLDDIAFFFPFPKSINLSSFVKICIQYNVVSLKSVS